MRVLSLAIGLLALVCVDLTLADGTGDSQQNVTRELRDEDWAPLHDKLYNKIGPYLKDDVVLELLEKLQKVYEPFSDEATSGRKTKINNLLEASVMDPKKCNYIYFEKLNSLINYNSYYQRTIVPYLTNHFINLLNMCDKPAFEENYSKIEEYEGDVKKLVQHIAMVEIPNEINPFAARVSSGLLSYLEDESGAKLPRRVASNDTGIQRAEQFFNDVIHMCGEWVRATDPLGLLERYGHLFEITRPKMVMNYNRYCKFISKWASHLHLQIFGEFEEEVKKGKDKHKHKHNKLLGLLCLGKHRDDTSN